jgi:kynurenine formamidase
VYVSQEAARYLAKSGVRSVGVAYLSVGGLYKDGVETRWALLGAGTWIIEGANLSAVELGECEWICSSLDAEDGDGAPDGAIFLR